MSLTPELWTRAKDLFEDALQRDLSPEDRSAFLKEACPDNDFVRAEVEALLIAHEGAGDFLESAPMPAFGLQLAATEQEGTKICPKCKTCFDNDCSECAQDGEKLDFAFPGARLIDNKYLVERQLGEGGMGMVYCAYHLGLARRFAVKIMSTATGASRVFLERFELEARVLGRMKHPNIVDVTDYGVDPREGGMPYLVMEYLEGNTLEDVCRRRDALPVEESLAVLRSVAEAVDAAHELGVLHGDLKPANVFLVKGTGKGAAGVVKILDFGLARLTGWHLDDMSLAVEANGNGAGPKKGSSKSPTMFGTPAYMAPELFSGETTNRASDIYSLGVIAYRLLSGELPSETCEEDSNGKLKSDPLAPSKAVQLAKKRQAEEALPSAAFPDEMDAPVMAMLVKEPARRPASAVAAVVAIGEAWEAAQRRHWIWREVPRRLMLAVLAAPLLAGLSLLIGHSGWIQDLEWKSEDFRFELAPQKAPDPRIVMVSIDEDSLSNNPTPLSQQVDEISAGMEQIFDAGAMRVAVDIVPPSSWSNSAAFSKMVLRHADSLTLGLFSTSSGSTGSECMAGLTAAALGPQRLSSMFAFVNWQADADNKIRRVPFFFRDREGGDRATLAAAVVRELMPLQRLGNEQVRVDYAIDWRRIPRISWKALPAAIARNSSLFRNKVVLLGAEYEGSGDEHLIPGEKDRGVSGLLLQTIVANTMIEGNPVKQTSAPQAFFIASLGGGLLFFAAVCLPSRAWALSTAFVCGIAYTGAVWMLFRWGQILLPLIVPLGAMVSGIILGLLVQLKLPVFPR